MYPKRKNLVFAALVFKQLAECGDAITSTLKKKIRKFSARVLGITQVQNNHMT